MKKIIALLLAVLMVLSLVACAADNKPAKADEPAKQEPAKAAEEAPASDVKATLSMGTGGDTGTYYAVGGVLANVIGQNSGVNITVVSTGGSKDNLVSMDQGMYQLATVQSDVMTYAYEGKNSFEESGALKGFNVLCALYAETVQIVTCDANLTSVDQLKGKSVCVGDVGSGTYFNTIDILAAYDMTIDDINPVYQSFGDSAESLKDGKIDAAFVCAGAPTPAITELVTAKPVYLVSIDDAHMNKLLESCPYYASYTIPAGTYGDSAEATTITVKATLVGSANLPEDVAYTIVSTIFGHVDDITELHAKGAELDLNFATDGIAVPFAAGAAKFFSENGITVATK